MRPIVTYSTDDPTVPQALRHVAYFSDGGKLLSPRFNGPTVDGVKKVAEDWWVAETARQAKIRGGTKKPSDPVSRSAPIEAAGEDDNGFGDLL